jgi:hypothetical protein
MDTTSVNTLVERASFVFAGTVTWLDASSLRALPARSNQAVVRFDRGFLINPVLGNLTGRPITVQLVSQAVESIPLKRGVRLIFFATAWVHGEEIAVTELARLADNEENQQEVSRIVESLPQRHLSERINSAVLIVHGKVIRIARASDLPRTGSEHDPYWMRAVIEVIEILKGSAGGPKAKTATVDLLFPGSGDIAFKNVPRPSLHQESIFLLHHGSGKIIPESAHIAPDPADIQPPSQVAAIRGLLG